MIFLIFELSGNEEFLQRHVVALQKQVDITRFNDSGCHKLGRLFRLRWCLRILIQNATRWRRLRHPQTRISRIFLITLIRFHYRLTACSLLRILGPTSSLEVSINYPTKFKGLFCLRFRAEIIIPNGIRLIEIYIIVSLVEWRPVRPVSKVPAIGRQRLMLSIVVNVFVGPVGPPSILRIWMLLPIWIIRCCLLFIIALPSSSWWHVLVLRTSETRIRPWFHLVVLTVPHV